MRIIKYAAAVAIAFASVTVIAPAAHAITVKPATVNFGTVALNKTKTKTISIQLDPGYSLNAILGGGGAFSQNLGNCTATSTKCKATMFFTPTSIGVYDTKITVRECTPGLACELDSISLHGVGGLLRATPSPIDFGSVPVNTVKSKPVSIRLDPGFHLNSIGTGGAPFSENPGNCTNTSTKCKVNAFFVPTSPGTFVSTFTAQECDAAFVCDTLSVTLHGVGV